MLSVKQEVIKYHFLSLWYDSIWDWTPISRTIDEHSKHDANRPVHTIDGLILFQSAAASKYIDCIFAEEED